MVKNDKPRAEKLTTETQRETNQELVIE